MRDLTAARNVAVINDAIAGEAHEIYFRRPTNSEMVAFQTGAFRRRGSKLENRLFETRLTFGAKVITGFRKGTLGCDGRAFSSDQVDPDYRDDWLELLEAHAPDIVAAVAMVAFEGVTVGSVDLLDTKDAEAEDPLKESASI